MTQRFANPPVQIAHHPIDDNRDPPGRICRRPGLESTVVALISTRRAEHRCGCADVSQQIREPRRAELLLQYAEAVLVEVVYESTSLVFSALD